MNIDIFISQLTSIFPEFKNFWSKEDICKEDDGTFTPHGLLMSFSSFYRNNYKSFSNSQYIALSNLMEGVVSSDPRDELPLANAICTCFIEYMAGDPEGEKLRPFLGKACANYFSHWV